MELTEKDKKCESMEKQVAELEANLEQARGSSQGYRDLRFLFKNATREKKALKD